jgi:hypothetical protein
VLGSGITPRYQHRAYQHALRYQKISLLVADGGVAWRRRQAEGDGNSETSTPLAAYSRKLHDDCMVSRAGDIWRAGRRGYHLHVCDIFCPFNIWRNISGWRISPAEEKEKAWRFANAELADAALASHQGGRREKLVYVKNIFCMGRVRRWRVRAIRRCAW